MHVVILDVHSHLDLIQESRISSKTLEEKVFFQFTWRPDILHRAPLLFIYDNSDIQSYLDFILESWNVLQDSLVDALETHENLLYK